MSIKTNTNCKECLHKNVCAFLNRPTLAVEEITEKIQTDTNALNIIVSCCHFNKSIHYSADIATPYGSYLDYFWDTENDWKEGSES